MELLEHEGTSICKGDVAQGSPRGGRAFHPRCRCGHHGRILPTVPPQVSGFSRGHPLDPGSEGSTLSALSWHPGHCLKRGRRRWASWRADV